MNSSKSLAEHLAQPVDIHILVRWNNLSQKSQTTLRWAIARAGINFQNYISGFNFELLTRLTLQDLRDTKNVGEKRAKELIDELRDFYSNSLTNQNFSVSTSIDEITVLENALDTSLIVLAYISVEKNLTAYQSRIAEKSTISDSIFRESLIDFRNGNPKKLQISHENSEIDLALLEIVKSQIQLPYAIARNIYPELDLRAKIIAGNLGLLGAIKTFDLKSSMLFVSYAELIIQEFIENLVFLSNLEYKTIEKLLLDGNSNSEFISINNESPLEILSRDANISEVFEFIEMKFRENPKIDDRTFSILHERLYLFNNNPSTLAAVGQAWNITRERIRQISKKWEGLKFEQFEQLDCLKAAVNCLVNSKDEDDFVENLTEIKLIGEIPLGTKRLKSICEFFSLSDLVEEIDKTIYNWENADKVESDFRRELKKLRSRLGLYDLSFLKSKFQITQAQIESSIKSIYPRTIIIGNLALARTKNLDTIFENSVAKQLLVASKLEVEDLIIGLERTANYRGVPLIGTKIDLGNLINYLAGEAPSFKNISPKMLKPITLQSIESWLVEIFNENDRSILHLTELVTRALKDNINISSLQVYLINSSIIRSHGGSIYSLVGSKIDIQNIEIYRKATLASAKATSIDFDVLPNGIKLSIQPNFNVITSGIIFPPVGLRKMVLETIFDSKCYCGKLVSKQQVKFSPSGFWTGFTAMIRHGMSEHKLTQTSEFVFIFDFEKSSVNLMVS